MITKKYILLFILASLLLTACGSSNPTAAPSQAPAASPHPPTSTAALPPTGTPLPTGTATLPPTATQPPTETQTATATFTATATHSATPVPTYVKLRGEVIVDQAVCHYGPGAPYLYKYGVYRGSNLEIIGRDPLGIYVEIQAIGGNNPCWVKAEYLKIKGDVMNVQPIDPANVKLPWSPYYDPPTRYSARRDGDTVTVFWSPLVLRPGDDSLQPPYIVEAWVCKNGQLVFTPVGSRQTAVKITDEPGCSEPSHGRLIAAEKHGYTRPVTIAWPQANETPQPSLTPTP